MKPFFKSLRSLTAGDLMKQPVQTIPQEMSFAAAGSILQRDRISGAPVIDASGRCVGVISTTDFLGTAAKEHHEGPHCLEEPCFSEWQVDV